MNPKTLQYLMGHSEIGVTVNTPYGHTHPAQPYSIKQQRFSPLKPLNL